MTRQELKAILLVGPTGSGKTPLGNLIENQGMNEKKCHHFDFGQHLRQAASGIFSTDKFSSEDITFIKQVLSSGALLENETFYLAQKLFKAFVEKTRITPEDIVIMNGLPRHIDQADDTCSLVAFETVIVLDCTPEVVFERIRLNSGGDRTRRDDDTLDKIRNKLDIYTNRTLPLLQYFSEKRIPLKSIQVDVDTKSEDMMTQI